MLSFSVFMNSLTPELLTAGILRYVVFLFSTTCHESAHALAAKWGGDLTAFHGGQVTLNPLPHIRREPFGMVAFPILSLLMGAGMFGWASAPYDPYWQHQYPKRAAWMSLAGPAANFTLMILAAIAMVAGLHFGFFSQPDHIAMTNIVDSASGSEFGTGVAAAVSTVFYLNLLLGTFNLLPIPPLDGFSVLGLFVSDSLARKLEEQGQRFRPFAFLAIAGSWTLLDRVFDPLYTGALNLLYWGSHYS
jgi:Zn-dependent protease